MHGRDSICPRKNKMHASVALQLIEYNGCAVYLLSVISSSGFIRFDGAPEFLKIRIWCNSMFGSRGRFVTWMCN
jgi:hypothetical protein